MKYHYLTDESEKSLAPFFSNTVLSAGFVSVVFLGVVLLFFWPRQPLHVFVIANNVPLAFFLIFTAALIISAYINLCCGCGDMLRRGYYMIKYRSDLATFEKEIDFLRYGLIQFLWHTLILLLPLLPLLIVATSASAVSFKIFMAAMSILYTVSLLCRMFGFVVYLFWGRLSTLGYIVARAFLIAYLFGTLLFAPFISPIQLLSRLSDRPEDVGFPFLFYLAAVVVSILILIVTSHLMVRRYIAWEEER